MDEISSEIVCLTLIAGRKQKAALLAAVSEAGGRIINVVYGKGSARASCLMDMFGLVPEENKVVIICLLSKEKSAAMFDMLDRKFNFDKPNTGIAFTISVERLSF